MGFEHFYQFIDRDVVDPMLRLKWTEYQKKYRVKREDVESIINWFDTAPSVEEMNRIIKTKTVLWTVKHGGLICLSDAIHCARSVKKRCPEVAIDRLRLEDVAVVYAAAVDGFLNNKIDSKTLNTAFAMGNQHGPR